MHDDYVVCRCEDVPLSAVQRCLAEAETTIGTAELKRRLRVGMGWCQGRVCGPLLAQLSGTAHGLDRNQVFRPISIAHMAAGDDDAGGDR